MPKKPKKTLEQKTAEEYFPVDQDNLKYTINKDVKEFVPVTSKHSVTEKPYKKIDRESFEIGGKKDTSPVKPARRKSARTKNSKSGKKNYNAKKTIRFEPPKICLKENSYELIITEKPQAALKIAAALGELKKLNNKGIPYYEVDRTGEKIVVACAVGHLFTLSQTSQGTKIPTFDISWVPNYLVRKKDFTKKYYDTLLNLIKNAGSLTVATDYDIEGEVIGWNVIRFIGNQKDASRMKFSTLTEKELNKAFENKLKHIDWGQAVAGETRHYLDWFYGINFSRALMNAIKTTGRFKIMSIGRVQGPALNLIVKKEREIQAFNPQQYWQVFITIENDDVRLELKHNKDIFKKNELKKFEGLKGKTTEAKTTKTEQSIPPPPPFNLTTLQTESYKFYGITPSQALKIAQSLYLAGLISYPRTSSQKLPESIGYKDILSRISKKYKSESLIKREKPVEGPKKDPAHPSIYPTGESQILSGQEEKIYNLIVKRFISLFCEDAKIANKAIKVEINNLTFSAKGTEIKTKGWMSIYPLKMQEKEIPDVNGSVKITNVKFEEKETQPPKRYSPASIISELEKRNLGTKATRSSILETLYDRGYIKEKSIQATPLGMSLINSLEKYSPIIIDEALTRDFEKQMESIQTASKDFLEKEKKIIDQAKTSITEIARQFEKNEKQIGKDLLNANIQLQEQEKEASKLIVCPKCKKGQLAITYSPKNRKHFIACDAYPNCKTTYSLPPYGKINKTDKICEACGFPMLMSLRAGKRPWIFCFNSECTTNKKRIEEYNKKKGKQE